MVLVPQGIAVDSEQNKMYWTDTLHETITQASLDGSSKITIINTGLYLPWSITLAKKRQ